MITRQFITELTTKFQTTEQNIVREYCQHLFLFYFYNKKGAEKIVFKGGTALRIVFNSPRFSEDLDFSASNNGTIPISEINQLIDDTLTDINKEGIECEKEVNPGTEGKTTGGYYATIKFKMLEFDSEIKLQISFRSPEKTKSKTTFIHGNFITPFIVIHLTEPLLVSEKIEALLERKKPRDFFDLYFILRDSELVKFIPSIPNLKSQLLKFVNQQNGFKELKTFLPISFHRILNNFKELLQKEIEKYIS